MPLNVEGVSVDDARVGMLESIVAFGNRLVDGSRLVVGLGLEDTLGGGKLPDPNITDGSKLVDGWGLEDTSGGGKLPNPNIIDCASEGM